MQLRDDNSLCTIDDEGAGVGHERQFAHVDLLLLDVLDRLVVGRAFAIIDDQAHGHAQRCAVAHAALAALALIERGFAQAVADVFEGRIARIARDREHRFQRRMQAFVFAGGHAAGVELEEFPVGIHLDSEQERNVKHDGALAEILADTLLLGERVGHGRVPPRVVKTVTAEAATWKGKRISAKSVSVPSLLADSRGPANNSESPGAYAPRLSSCLD